jgi:hypothetical protein
MNIPGFSGEASLYETSGYYHSAHAFTEAGGNALLPAQGWCPQPWGYSCIQSCRRWCGQYCRHDPSCDLLNCNEDCWWRCNCYPP